MRQEAELVSGPDRKTSMAAEMKSEHDSKELGEIRKEVIEARNLVIKTDNLLKNLHAEVKAIGKRHEDLQKRQWISSGVAYVLFAALCVAGAVAVASVRGSAASAEHERQEKAVAQLTAQLEQQRLEQSAAQTAQRSATEVYRLMTTLTGEERLRGADEFLKLDVSHLSPLEQELLKDKATALRHELGDAALDRGRAAFRRNDWRATIDETGRFLNVEKSPQPEQVLEASFMMGVAYNTERKHTQAVPHLKRFVDGDKKSKQRDYAMLLLAQSYQETNQLDQALTTTQTALESYPNSEFTQQRNRQVSSIRRQRAGNNAEGQAAPAPAAPTPAAPAPAAPTPAAAPTASPSEPPAAAH